MQINVQGPSGPSSDKYPPPSIQITVNIGAPCAAPPEKPKPQWFKILGVGATVITIATKVYGLFVK
jgi:hypothetical protein